MHPFHKYSEIQQSYQQTYVDLIKESIAGGWWPRELKWYVTEKIHGSNLAFVTDGTSVHIAKRTGLLDDDNFYGASRVLAKYGTNAILGIFKMVSEHYGTPDNPVIQVQCFGEIYGGKYPHPSVEKNKFAKQVQKGVYYRPDNDFYGFDISYLLKDETYRFVSQTHMYIFYVENGFYAAKPLFIGSFEECLQYPNFFQTTIPKELGLPEIADNICEGIVIKPSEDVRMRNGDRPLIKNKNDRFKEVSRAKKVLLENNEPRVSPEGLELGQTILDYVNDNRLNNVLSKTGPMEMMEQFRTLLTEFSEDIFNDFMKDHGELFNILNNKDQKYIKKRMNNEAAYVIKVHYHIINEREISES